MPQTKVLLIPEGKIADYIEESSEKIHQRNMPGRPSKRD
jgi:hypothetical protein